MIDRPTLHLTNWSSRAQHGPGRKLCAMASPRTWEHGEGRVRDATPRLTVLLDWQQGRISLADYRELAEARFRVCFVSGTLLPGALAWYAGKCCWVVSDGDTLLCSCPRPDSPRRTHECHLEWLAPFLARAGWRVILYGQEVTP